jgi:hypothetical protein
VDAVHLIAIQLRPELSGDGKDRDWSTTVIAPANYDALLNSLSASLSACTEIEADLDIVSHTWVA